MEPEPETPRTSDTVQRELRYEVKMVCEEMGWSSVRAHLHLNAACLRPIHVPRRVQSVYLDTHEGRALGENLAGISHREKLRFRWYGDAATGVRGTLEKKVRHNMLGWKELLPVPETVDVEGCSRLAFVAMLLRHAPPDWAEDIHGQEPVQWISYSREYFRTPDARVRVTVDRDLRAADQRFLPALSARFATPTPRIVVVEFKSKEEDYAAVRDIVARFPLMYDRCSKFVLASSPGDGPHASFLEP